MALNDKGRGGTTGGAEHDPVLDRLYRAGASEEPPAHLDAAILAAARREVGARPQPLSRGLRRWRVPVSLAAVVVLSVSLVTLVREEGGDSLLRSPPEAIPPLPATQPALPPPVAPAENQQARSSGTTAAPREDARIGTTLGKAAESASAGAPGPAAVQGSVAAVAPEPAAKPSPQPFRDSAEISDRAASTGPASGTGQEFTTKAPAAAERRAAPMAAAPAADAGGSRVLAQQARKESAASEDRAPVWQGFEKEPPQKWLARIEELRRQQRTADAEAMLAEFRRRFPGHPLPAGQP